MAYPEMEETLWFAGRWWWFPGSRIDAEPIFEWREKKVYLLEPDGSAVAGILFVGEVAPDRRVTERAACHVRNTSYVSLKGAKWRNQ